MELDLTASNLETEIWITSCLSEKLLLARAGIELTGRLISDLRAEAA